MLIPLRTDRDLRRRPVITESIIIANVLVYVAGFAGPHFGFFDPGALQAAGSFKPFDFSAWNLVSYQFLHGGFWHILFNMLFFWVFGSAVEDRIGRIGFLGFYLIGGAVAALAHAQVTQSPVIGASGSVAAVTGAFLALFPRSTIKVLFLFFIISILHIPALWLIAFYFAIDVLSQFTDFLRPGQAKVAYMAHIAGYLYGFLLAFTLLGLRIVKREDFDVFFLFSQWRRRAAFRAAAHESRGAMWDAPIKTGHERLGGRKSKAGELTERERADAAERSAIAKLIADRDLPAAAKSYRQLLSRNSEAVFPEDRQLDLANQLAAESEHRHAATAYELLLKSYPNSPKADEVRLILGMIYARRLGNRERARELLEAAKRGLRDPKHTQFADQLLAEI